MKLFELMPDPTDIMDPIGMRDEENRIGTPMQDIARNKDNPKYSRGKNMKKAKQIAARVKLKKRESPEPFGSNDTPAQSSLGGHGSSFLFR